MGTSSMSDQQASPIGQPDSKHAEPMLSDSEGSMSDADKKLAAMGYTPVSSFTREMNFYCIALISFIPLRSFSPAFGISFLPGRLVLPRVYLGL